MACLVTYYLNGVYLHSENGNGNAFVSESMSGHTSPVECVAFDSTEVLVVTGASTGAIKLWDLREAKIVHTLTGHRINCTAIEFLPFG
uniref:Katanin p80 WD40 repeat-containing subunit B1 homolog n=1 Tax=Nelumbo nucifera TaxID=4432 RepID=A0A822Y1E4_NELNU|nr:TPA_asm: hypothetical protein HUJ06_026360 [Nelumbo nucifera]